MSTGLKEMSVTKAEIREDFNLSAAITVMLLLLIFIAASFYIIVSSYMEIN